MNFKLAILGKSLVGKSALIFRYINDKFPELHDTTIEDQYNINTSINGIECNVEILDTAGQESYQTMLDSWIHFANGYVLVYSINDKESFEVVKDRLNSIFKLKFQEDSSTKPCIIVIGNKTDLDSDRIVEYDTAYDYCKELDVDYIECSALSKLNVKEAFSKLLERMINSKRKNTITSSKKEVKEKRCFCF